MCSSDLAGEDAPVRVDLLDVPVQLQVRDVRHQELRPEALRLGAHGIGQGPAVRPPRSGVVDDLLAASESCSLSSLS